MRTAVVTIEGISPYQQGRYHKTPKLEKEAADDYEKRTWQEKCHTHKDGTVFIPPMAFKKALDTAASMISMKVPGKAGGKATYTKYFIAGIMVADGLNLPVKKNEVDGFWVLGNSQGRRGGSGSRVEKCFPTIYEWGGNVTYYILDDTITPEIFELHVKESGNFVGIGVFRPQNGGYHGRFVVKKVKWE